jgi:23S rRNA (cytidine1920-2'-O)/16S rRNA (cytidine1409-2'-O)-methyltransferase
MRLNKRVSRAGEKLAAALNAWRTILPPLRGITAADFGSNVGGFVQCLLAEGVVRVYAVDTGYGVLDWTLRNDVRVIVMERTNALHVKLPEQVDLVTIDTAWTRQQLILESAWRVLKHDGYVIALVKPQYEATKEERKGGVPSDNLLPGILERVRADVTSVGGQIIAECESPMKGARGNTEYLWLVRRS